MAKIKSEFDRALEKALRLLPSVFQDALANVAIIVEDRPSRRLLDELGVSGDETLYGFFHGIPLPERSVNDSGNLPDAISIYRKPLEDDFPDPVELAGEIRVTLLHEIGHYFGMEEEELERLGYQ